LAAVPPPPPPPVPDAEGAGAQVEGSLAAQIEGAANDDNVDEIDVGDEGGDVEGDAPTTAPRRLRRSPSQTLRDMQKVTAIRLRVGKQIRAGNGRKLRSVQRRIARENKKMGAAAGNNR
ncbi:MAG: hypothetical protein KC613_06460, partial [Myxococcales bacterium]|nr:hypothetical protein [Myxococcales bacterium]